ncbi:50S ribosomal protein L17 [Candidatus Parcubacteria bacterium]|nr:50S ribosomal protein L17 [Candidatus Parcubacteria bacterium]
MRHRIKKTILDRKKAPREMMLRNLAASVLIYEKVSTTEAKAKAVRSLVEKSITIAKKNDLSSRRRLIALLPQPNAVKKLMEVIGKRYQDRKGGYTRIIRLNNRQGDGAKIVQIELV